MRCQRNANFEVKRTGARVLRSDDVGAAVQDLVGWVVVKPLDEIDGIIATEEFGIMFIHCLGQAMYHSMRVLAEDPTLFTPPAIELSMKGGVLKTLISNPGKNSGKVSRDTNEFKKLAKHFIPSGDVRGPEWRSDCEKWVTEFELPCSWRISTISTDFQPPGS